NFLIVALAILDQALDGRLLQEARAVGERLLETAEPRNDQVTIGRAAYRLGGLFLDPVKAIANSLPAALAGGDPSHFWARWREQMCAFFGDEFRRADESEFAPPDPLDMLATAAGYYRRAIPAREGNARGMAAKALLETLNWQKRCGTEIDHREFE